MSQEWAEWGKGEPRESQEWAKSAKSADWAMCAKWAMSEQEWTKSETTDPCEPNVSQEWVEGEPRMSQGWAKNEPRESQEWANWTKWAKSSREWAKWATLRDQDILLFAVCFSLLIWQT